MAVLTRLDYPFTETAIRALHVGCRVSVFGKVFTGRDRFHKYLHEGRPTPVDLHDAALYHCGPVIIRREGAAIVQAAGPTTSIREEPYMPALIATQGLRLILGKGGMGPATLDACGKYGCAYVQLTGGAAGLLADRIANVETVHLLDQFGPAEAVWVLNVQGLEGVVTMDTHGKSLHARVLNASRRALRRLLAPQPATPTKDHRRPA